METFPQFTAVQQILSTQSRRVPGGILGERHSFMCERPKVHVFLGAPPPPSPPPAGSEGGEEEEEESPLAGWRRLELTWRDGRLIPADPEGAGRAEEGSRNRERPPDPDSDPVPRTEPGPVERPEPAADVPCRASLHRYLDLCFPTAPPEPGPGLGPGPGPGPGSGPPPDRPPAASPPSPRAHYLTTWTLSQALVLRHAGQSASSPEKTPPQRPLAASPVSSSTPELFSPATPSPGATAELSSPSGASPRVTKGGVVLEATTDGVLCSQESPSASANTSPVGKRARPSERFLTEAPRSVSAPGGLRGATALLSRCDQPGARYSVLVAAVHPCHLKEVKVKSGPSAGTAVPLASVVVTDQSGVERKVVLWRRAAFWAVTVRPGDILLVTALQVSEDRWRGETLLQSTFGSKLLNLGRVAGSAHPPGSAAGAVSAASRQVDSRSLAALCHFLRRRRPLLASLPHGPPQDLNRIPYVALRSLRADTLVHAVLRVTRTHLSSAWREEAESRSRSATQRNAVVTVEQADGQQGALLLWGAAADWLPRINADTASPWDFRVLLVRDCPSSGAPELHSTPWSSVHAVPPGDRRAQDFLLTRRRLQEAGGAVELDVETLLSQKYSGEVALRAQLASFRFQGAPLSQDAPQPVLDGSSPLEAVMAALSGDVTYAGCGRCCAELDTDANGIYGPCYPCLPHTAVRRYYRPGVLTVSGRSLSQLRLLVPPVLLQSLLSAPPDRLLRPAAFGSTLKNLQVAAERLQSLLSLPRKTFAITLRSCFLLDENGASVHQDFTLTGLQPPTPPPGGAAAAT